MDLKNILFEIKNSIAIITVNRPEKLNALNEATIKELGLAINEVENNSEIKAAILTGAGEKAFVAGADISELSKLGMIEATEASKLGQRVFSQFEMCSKPVIGLINGFALGGGCELAMSCHFRIASNEARFGQPEVNLGLVPGYGGTQRLPRIVGRGIALELLLSGDMISAQRAYEIGLVNKVVEQKDLLDEGLKVLSKIISKGPIAVKYCIEAVHHGLNSSLETGLEMEANYFGMAFGTEDKEEGTSAFLEKRKAKFQGK
ncbi:MAG: hypothetical protein D8M58_12125 [Calditrichaeota bacterium]|nr:MAG: hypothetical protein DWQ03_12910 [Calditrichota bacterium]MBL1206143.1 hypothetical protein [Calditrichota bacterium]NOG45968.1 hypothetical protein [Calditrichota bacterium]